MSGLIGIIKAAGRTLPEGTGPIGDSHTRTGGKGPSSEARDPMKYRSLRPKPPIDHAMAELQGLDEPDLEGDPDEGLDIHGRDLAGPMSPGELDSNQQQPNVDYGRLFQEEHPLGQDPGISAALQTIMARQREDEDPHSNHPTNRAEMAPYRGPSAELPSSHHLQRPRRKVGVLTRG